jgi:hypothetical protein
MGVKKDIARYVGIIGLPLGVIVAAIGSLWNPLGMRIHYFTIQDLMQ